MSVEKKNLHRTDADADLHEIQIDNALRDFLQSNPALAARFERAGAAATTFLRTIIAGMINHEVDPHTFAALLAKKLDVAPDLARAENAPAPARPTGPAPAA